MEQEGVGTRIFIYGLLGFVCCGIFAIIAWVEGAKHLDNKDYAEKDYGLLMAGKVMGQVVCLLHIAGCCFYGAIIALAGSTQPTQPSFETQIPSNYRQGTID